jgi:hypothetical protein
VINYNPEMEGSNANKSIATKPVLDQHKKLREYLLSVELKKWKDYWRKYEKKPKEPDDRRQEFKNIFRKGRWEMMC